MSDATLAEIFDRAADRIERDGWHQGEYYPSAIFSTVDRAVIAIRESNPPCCLWGSLYAEGFNPLDDEHYTLMTAGVVPGPYWNDKEDRTQDEVIAKLRELAEKTRSEGK